MDNSGAARRYFDVSLVLNVEINSEILMITFRARDERGLSQAFLIPDVTLVSLETIHAAHRFLLSQQLKC